MNCFPFFFELNSLCCFIESVLDSSREGVPCSSRPLLRPHRGNWLTEKSEGDPGHCAPDRRTHTEPCPVVPKTQPCGSVTLLTWPKLVLSSSWLRVILTSLQVAISDCVEHVGSLSDCSRFVFTSCRLVLSRAVDFFSSPKVLFTFSRVSLVSLIAVGTQSALEQGHPLAWRWQITSYLQQSPKGTWHERVYATGRPPEEPAARGSLRGEHRDIAGLLCPSLRPAPLSHLGNMMGISQSGVHWLSLAEQLQERVLPP